MSLYNNEKFGEKINIIKKSVYSQEDEENSVPPVYYAYWIDDEGNFITTDNGDNIIFD